MAMTSTTAETPTTSSPVGVTTVRIQGQSGKFTLSNSARGSEKDIVVTMDALRELDAQGNAVGASGSTKHSLNTFASQDFTILDANLTTV
eukprot:CAMPEP_0170588190 /NCGR_PEP_ID=MMETSP0224-20130122/10699_1 /TAXON_ID=285029 /ORGANISM="Togula jolla, Strain CCCM 725" /LENGTH=89 /DNA_ID=CAMNT_0010911893 /DNA_START=87 /DNA_END=352 /DNA_ORIENTATION=-